MTDFFSYPSVSVITVNLNGRDYLGPLLESLESLDYPREAIEFIMVDNNSTDGSVDFVRQKYPRVKIIKNSFNTGFAVANNQGAKEAAGEYVAFLNNDMKVDRAWLIELVKPVFGDAETVCSGSKVLSIDGKSLDFAGSMINFEGKGFQKDYGLPVEADIYTRDCPVPFVNGGAMLVKKDIFLSAGGFDEDFFAYYEDVDLGWRLWVLGYKVVFAPKSVVYHVHHGTSKLFADDKLRFLKERNALFSVFKNYDDENLAKVFGASLAGLFNRVFVDVNFDYRKYYDFSDAYKYDRTPQVEPASVSVDSQPLSSLMAARAFFDALPALKQKREKIQSMRRRDDKAVFTYFQGQFLAVSPDVQYQRTQIEVLKSLGIYDVFTKKIKRNLLIISQEVVASAMAGPAIRAFNFAMVLSEHINVILAVPNKSDLKNQVFEIVRYSDEASIRELLGKCDIVLCSGMTFSKFKCIRSSDKYIIMDIYDPYNLATLTEYGNETIERQLDVYKSVHFITNEMLYYGDFYICASERQRDFWIGMLAALNRVNPYSYNQDPALRKLIDVVPFGLPSAKPVLTENVLKGKIEGICKDDFVILWGGGIYNWFDPLTLINAMADVWEKRKNIKLFFLGVRHPNPQVKELSLADQAVELAKKLGLYNKNVFFNFGWVDYDSRQNYFLESDAGIITHPDHIETRFAFRTRILDYLWTSLPVISTKGDSLSDLVQSEALGITVDANDSGAICSAILKLAGDKDFHIACRRNISRVAQNYTWEKVCAPLVDFCKDPVSSAVREKLRPDQVHTSINVLDIAGSTYKGTGNSGSGNRNYAAGIAGAEPNRSKKYLLRRFFYHFFKGGPGKAFAVYSNYKKGNFSE